MERTASVDDLVGNLWRLGRTPSQAEFEQFFSNFAQANQNGSQQNLASIGEETPVANPGGIPRVASIDLLRKMIMTQQMQGVQAPGVPPMIPPQAAIPGANLAAFAAGAFTAALPTAPVAPAAVAAPAPVVAGHGLDAAAAQQHTIGTLAQQTSEAPNPAGQTIAKPTPAPQAPVAETKTAPAKKPPAKKQKTAAKTPTPPPPTSNTGSDGKDDGSDYDSELDGELGDGKGGTADEVRRQRRMLSNRESARRSRRRKLEHVSTLEGQINNLRQETNGVVERLRETEQRLESALRENAGLKADVDRLNGQLREAAAGGKMERSSSLQRISSSEHLAKRGRDQMDSPRIGGDDSPRGFVPFRSLQSYENLLSLQVQAQSR